MKKVKIALREDVENDIIDLELDYEILEINCYEWM